MTYVYNPETIKSSYGTPENTVGDQANAVTGSLNIVAPAVLTADQLEPFILVDANVTLPDIPENTGITFVANDTTYTVTTSASQQFSNDGVRTDVATFTTAGAFTVYRFADINDTLYVTSVLGTVAFA